MIYKKQKIIFTFLRLLVLFGLLIMPISVFAAPLSQDDDPAVQCAKGVQLFESGYNVEALPFLEAGFTNRSKARTMSLDELGKCSLALGLIYENNDKIRGAIEAYLVALQAFQENGNRQFESSTLNNLGKVYDDQGQYLLAKEYYEQALVLAREMNDRNREGTIINNLGTVYFELGQSSQALENLQQALMIRREVGDREGEGLTLRNIGAIFDAQGEYKLALDYYNEALTISQETGDRKGELKTLNIIGDQSYRQGNHTVALVYFQKALVIARELSARADQGTSLNGIGLAYLYLGYYVEAIGNFENALSIRREVGDRDGESATLNNFGLVYQFTGKYAKALAHYQLALSIERELNYYVGESTTLNNIGTIYWIQGRYPEALDCFNEALQIQRQIDYRAGLGNTLNNIGLIYHYQLQHAKALEYFQQALVIWRSNGSKAGESNTLHNIGSVYWLQGEYVEALAYLQPALKIQQETGDKQSQGKTLLMIGMVYSSQQSYTEALSCYEQALEIAEEANDHLNEAYILNNIGVVYDNQGVPGEAAKYYEQSMGMLETLRTMAGSESARASFIGQYKNLYDLAIEHYFNQNQPEKAFSSSERGRARSFLDSVSTGYVELIDDKSNLLYEKELEAYAIRQAAQDALSKARTPNSPNEKLIADLETQLAQAEKDYQTVLDSITADGDHLEQLIPGRSKVLDVFQAQALLDDKTTMVSFWVLDEQTLVFVLTDTTFDAVSLPIKRTDLYSQIEAFRSFSNADPAYAFPESALKLYQALIKPLKSRLSTSNLIIIPHGELHYLPFSALTDGSHFLMDEYVITYSPSVSALPFIRKNAQHAGKNALILGNSSTNVPDLRPLAYAEREAREVASSYGAEPLLGAMATESKFKWSVSQAGLIHLAVHGQYNATNPLYSTLYLTPDGENDGLLEVHEIYGLDLRQTNLVVLSACETQLGELGRGDELVGFTRAFFFAGTPTVVASLWSVDDEATGMLMKQFYTHMKEGLGKAEALRQAQLDVRAKYPNPYYWSGFVLSGDGGIANDFKPLALETSKSPYLYIIGVLCCLFCLGLVALITAGGFLWIRRIKGTRQDEFRKI